MLLDKLQKCGSVMELYPGSSLGTAHPQHCSIMEDKRDAEGEIFQSSIFFLLAVNGFRSAKLVGGGESIVNGGGVGRQGGEGWGLSTSIPHPPISGISSPFKPSLLTHSTHTCCSGLHVPVLGWLDWEHKMV